MLETKDLCFGYAAKRQYKNFNVRFEQTKLHCILGPNGSGKSTFLKAMLGIVPIFSGDISINGQTMLHYSRKKTAQHIAYVPQTGKSVPISVYDTVLLGRMPYIRGFGGAKDKTLVDEILEKLSITSWKNRLLTELSGGERQKVFLAKALVQDTQILFFDEPTNNLDIRWQIELYDLFKTISEEEKKIVIIVEHDLSLAFRYADCVHILKDGAIITSGIPEKTMKKELLASVYGIETEYIKNNSYAAIIATKTIRADHADI